MCRNTPTTTSSILWRTDKTTSIMAYRALTDEEINILDDNGCWAEDWGNVSVSDDFVPQYMRHVMLYGEITIGCFSKNVEVSQGFLKHSGIYNATLRNVSVGDDCLIENICNYINNYTIGNDCRLSNIATMETTEGATYGQGNIVSVLNETGDGNVMFFNGLSSQVADLMVKHNRDKDFRSAMRRLIGEDIKATAPDRGTLGDGVKIVNTKEITNTLVGDECEINGAARLSDVTILSSPEATVYIGTGVICENSIISNGASLANSVKMQDCFVGEACKVSNGFTASQSVFFANCFMSNGEACSAFCGPFTVCHHKNTLLVGSRYSFCDVDSAASLYSKTQQPGACDLPFSCIIADGDALRLEPGRNICSAELYRNTHKWPRRDVRAKGMRKSIVNFDWLSPYSVGEIIKGKKILEGLLAASGEDARAYNYHEFTISAPSLRAGIRYYDMALRVYIGAALERALNREQALTPPDTEVGPGPWDDLSGLLLPATEEERLVNDVKTGELDSVDAVLSRLVDIDACYVEYHWAWTCRLILTHYNLQGLDDESLAHVTHDCQAARREWIDGIRKDAEKEFKKGYMEPEAFDSFCSQLDQELEPDN